MLLNHALWRVNLHVVSRTCLTRREIPEWFEYTPKMGKRKGPEGPFHNQLS
jgi:hypothetical protein